jgi:pimeloyl-ACP methyl ester carboxylesterase/DNA-binding SARP family transcriptional activator
MMCPVEIEDRSPVRFARVDGAAVAYQTWGNGPAHVVAVPPLAQNIELTWERPEYQAFFARLGTFARVLHFDKRGTGASDRTDRMPTVDQRVEDIVAVMDAAGFDRAHLVGISEGGPVAIALAATYPERVETLTLYGCGARMVGDLTDDQRTRRQEAIRFFHERWGTEQSVTLEVFAPSVAGDAGYRLWEPRYERQSATPGALREILDMIEAIDVRALLDLVLAPTLVIHRRDDGVVPVALARETASLLRHARLVELDGADHFPHVGDVDGWLDHLEQFVAGAVSPRARRPQSPDVRIATMGGFGVSVDGEAVAASAWGSRQARVVCKRLAVAVDRPVRRDELTDVLWPEESDPAKLSARLSVVLSNIRRVLRGGLIADRDTVQLDLAAVDVDLVPLSEAIARGDDAAVLANYAGPILPEEAYEDWATAARQRFSSAVTSARRRIAGDAASDGRWDEVVEHAHAMLDLDPFDERAHELLVQALLADGRRGEARTAVGRYEAAMAELGVQPQDLLSAEPVAPPGSASR